MSDWNSSNQIIPYRKAADTNEATRENKNDTYFGHPGTNMYSKWSVIFAIFSWIWKVNCETFNCMWFLYHSFCNINNWNNLNKGISIH